MIPAPLAENETQRLVALDQYEVLNTLPEESAGEGTFGLDSHGLTIYANPAASAMLGYKLIGVCTHITMHQTKPDGSPYPHETCPM